MLTQAEFETKVNKLGRMVKAYGYDPESQRYFVCVSGRVPQGDTCKGKTRQDAWNEVSSYIRERADKYDGDTPECD